MVAMRADDPGKENERHKKEVPMKKLFDRLVNETSTVFGEQTPSKHTGTEILADVLATPFHILGRLTRGGGELRRVHLPPPPEPTYIPPPPPGKEELYAAAIWNYQRNCSLIVAAPLSPEEKEALLDEERQVFTDTLRGILDQA